MPDPKTYTEEEFNAILAERDAVAAKNREFQSERRKDAERLKAYDGVDAEEYRTLKQQAAEAEKKRALAEGNLETWKKQVTDEFQKERDTIAKRELKYKNALEARKVATLTEALAKADALPEMMDLLTLKGSTSIRLRETDDGWDEYVSDQHGTPLVADSTGAAMSVSQYVDKVLKTQYPNSFKGTGSSGGGAVKSAGSAGGPVSIKTGADFLKHVDDIASGKIVV